MTTPFMTTADVAAYLRLLDREGRPDLAKARWLIDHHISPERVYTLGRTLRVHQDDVLALLQPRTPR